MSGYVKKNNFTLIEALIAAGIMTLAAIAIISLLVFNFRFSNFIDRNRIVSQVATSRMEILCQMDFADLSPTTNTVRVNEDGVRTDDGMYLCTTTLTRESDGGMTLSVKVESPGDSMRSPTEFELVTLRYE